MHVHDGDVLAVLPRSLTEVFSVGIDGRLVTLQSVSGGVSRDI